MEKKLNDVLSKMSVKELENLKEHILEEIKEKTEEERKRQQIKEDYAIVEPVVQYEPSYTRLWNIVKKIVSEGGSLNSENIEEIYEQGCYLVRTDPSKVYPCPECGETNCLYSGDFAKQGDSPDYHVCCSCCSFVCEAKGQKTEEDAWNVFIKWLIKNGYLKKEEQQK